MDTAATVYEGYEAIVGLTDGVWDYSDAFNLLSLVPFAVPAIASPSSTNPDFNTTFPSTGLYTLAIAGTSSTPVDYRLTVTDNTAEPITSTGLGVVESGTLNAGETINYEFSAKAGTPVFFDGQGSDTTIRAKLIDSDGNTVFTNHQTPSDRGPSVLPQTGTHTLQLSGANSSSTGDYQFQLLSRWA